MHSMDAAVNTAAAVVPPVFGNGVSVGTGAETGFGASYITTVLLPSFSILFATVNGMLSATSYPSGAVISVKTYSPSARFLILCGSVVDVHDSTTAPFFVMVSCAPGSSAFVVTGYRPRPFGRGFLKREKDYV